MSKKNKKEFRVAELFLCFHNLFFLLWHTFTSYAISCWRREDGTACVFEGKVCWRSVVVVPSSISAFSSLTDTGVTTIARKCLHFSALIESERSTVSYLYIARSCTCSRFANTTGGVDCDLYGVSNIFWCAISDRSVCTYYSC